jgi:hypothetical protein
MMAAVAEMLRQGFNPAEIGKIGGGNFCRVFDKVTAGHASGALIKRRSGIAEQSI